jgi:adenylate cyclase
MSDKRKIAAILVADVAGYSRLAGADEDRILARLRTLRSDLIDPTIAVHNGRVVKRTGDGSLIEFRSVVDAVRCAIEVQNAMVERNAGLPPERRIEFRVGIHLGDVVEESDGDLMGDGVNIAARLEGIAKPGAICLSEDAYRQVKARIDLPVTDLGAVQLKNIVEPIRVYSLEAGVAAQAKPAMPAQSHASEEPSALPPLPDKPSIAVLAFNNMSGDAEQEYFGDGIAEDIITALSRLRGFFVIARNSTFAYKGKAVDIRHIARDLGVRYVLEGSVRRSGDRLRINSQLIDASSGAQVWSERYDRAVADIFAVQDEITENVVASIESQVYAAENIRSESKATESLDAWGCVVRAMPYVWTWAAQDNQKSVELLKRALDADPHYARASSLLAWAYAARAQLGWSEPSEELEKALTMARQAIEQDWEDPWAHLAAGYVHMVSRRFNSAVQELNEALEQNPNFAFAHMLLGSTYGYAGEPEEGLSHVSLAHRLSPRDHNQAANFSTMGLCHLMARRFNEAEACERRAVQLRPHFGTAWRTLAAAAGLAGHFDAAAEALAQIKRLQPNVSLEWIEKYHPIVHAQDRAMYIEGLRQAGLD